MEINQILKNLKEDKISIEEAENELKKHQYEDIGYAKIDHDRKERVGVAEVIFCEGLAIK